MKHYLFTWYGITDLRAALGFEEHGGPVLGALRAGKYSDAMILAYTDPLKAGDGIEEEQRNWLAEHSVDAHSPSPRLTRQQELEAVDLFSNTAAAHQLYKKWLRSQLYERGLSVAVIMCVKEMGCLNDAKRIYDAASKALEIVSEDRSEKQLTFYLSPGTPVMAFTWAFVSMVNPESKINVIASPDFRKPPVEITLPYELLAPTSRSRKPKDAAEVKAFDTIFHLFGEQRLPSVLGVQQFEAGRHIFVSSKQYDAGIMRQFLPKNAEYQQLIVDPFDPMSAKVSILRAVSGLGRDEHIGFNLTGGTKLMFAGAIAACRKIGGVPFYFETRDHNLIFLHDYTVMPMRGIDSVEMFFRANNFSIVTEGRWEDSPSRNERRRLTKGLWEARWLVAKLYRELSQHTEFVGKDFKPFQISQTIRARGRQVFVEATLDKQGQAHLKLDQLKFTSSFCPDFAKYLCGGWLEEYTYLLLEPLLEQGKIHDLRVGLEVSWDDTSTGHMRFPAQEFDVVFTDGKRLFIIECKAGSVTSEHVYKIQNCIRNYGGIDARGVMVSAFPPHHSVTKRRLRDARNLASLSGWDVTNELAALVTTHS